MENSAQALSLSLLPERRTNWRALGASFVLQTLILFLLIQLGLIQPQKLLVKTSYHLTPLVMVTETPPAVPKSIVHPRLLPPATIITARHEVRPPTIKNEPPAAPQVKLPPAEVASVLKPAGGARPPMLVRTGEFGSSVKPTINKPPEQVQTGGFGDELGAKSASNGNAHLVMARLGSFDLPSGVGQGNGTGNQHGTTGTVASAGFGSNIALPSQGDGRSNGRGTVQAGAFGDTHAVLASASRPVEISSPTTPVEILSKPVPVYTTEARQLHIEGEVLLNVTFAASGQAHVLGVVRGLGHGLDEAAIAAATRIHFRPAQREGHAVDSTAVLHVIFQLAN
jgi:TonB family protein